MSATPIDSGLPAEPGPRSAALDGHNSCICTDPIDANMSKHITLLSGPCSAREGYGGGDRSGRSFKEGYGK